MRSPARAGGSARPAKSTARRTSGRGARLTVRQLARGADDGYAHELLPGLSSSADATRLAEELAFAAARLLALASDPPGPWAEALVEEDAEEALWLCFLTAYLGPADGEQPFAAVEQARVSWAAGEQPRLDAVEVGPRGAHAPERGALTIDAYRAWAARSGSQRQALLGDVAWSSERRFARAYERLSLPGFGRDARFDLLVVIGRLGLLELSADALHLGGTDEVTVAAKRAFGIGDPLLLERRAAALAAAADVPLAALDLGLFNWGRGTRHAGGMADLTADPAPLLDALGLQ